MALRDMADGPSPLARLIGNLDERPCRVIEIPGRGEERIGIWVLTLSEEERARKAAYKFLRDPKGLAFDALDLEYDEQRALNDSIMVEVLAEALREPDDHGSRYAADSREIRDRLSSGEIQGLWREYLTYAAERATLKDVEDPEKELDELVRLVLQGFPLAMRASRFASPSLRLLLTTAIGRLASGTTPSSSDGSSPSASDDTSSAP